MANGNYGGGLNPVGSVGNYNPPPTAAQNHVRETVGAALDYQQDRIGNLHTIISELEARLVAVLEIVPGDTSTTAPPAPAPVSVLQRVALANGGIEAAMQRIAMLVKRLQL